MKENKTVAPTGGKFTSHSVNIVDRKKATMTGVAKVDSSDAAEITLTTCLGRLIVTGSDLQIVKFDDGDGNLALTGNIDAIKYAQAKQPLLKRLFK